MRAWTWHPSFLISAPELQVTVCTAVPRSEQLPSLGLMFNPDYIRQMQNKRVKTFIRFPSNLFTHSLEQCFMTPAVHYTLRVPSPEHGPHFVSGPFQTWAQLYVKQDAADPNSYMKLTGSETEKIKCTQSPMVICILEKNKIRKFR